MTLDLTPADSPYLLPWVLGPHPIHLPSGMSVVPLDTITFVSSLDRMRSDIDDDRRRLDVKKAAVWAGLNERCRSLRAQGNLRVPKGLTDGEEMELQHWEQRMRDLQPLTLDKAERKRADLKAIVKMLLVGQVRQTGYGFIR